MKKRTFLLFLILLGILIVIVYKNPFSDIKEKDFSMNFSSLGDTNWQKCLTFSTKTSYPKNYLHRITLSTAISGFNYKDFRKNGADVRWLEGNCNDANTTAGELNHFIGVWDTTGDSYLYFQTINANRTDVSMYYKNPSAVSTSDISKMGNFNEHFDSALDQTKWVISVSENTSACNWVANSILNLTCYDDIIKVYSIETFGVNHALEAYLRGGNYTAFGFWEGGGGGNKRLGYASPGANWSAFAYSGGSNQMFESLKMSVFNNGYRIHKIIRNQTRNSAFWINDSLKARINGTAVPSESINVRFLGHKFNNSNIASSIEIDWVIVRNYSDPEPVWNPGKVENLKLNRE